MEGKNKIPIVNDFVFHDYPKDSKESRITCQEKNEKNIDIHKGKPYIIAK